MNRIVVYDTNVLLSAIGWKGQPRKCLELARTSVVRGLTCQPVLTELAEKLDSRLALSDKEIASWISDLLRFLRLVPIPGTLKVIAADPDDDAILECAVVGGATHIVTGDRRHLLPLGNYQGISIVTPAQFIALAEGPRHPTGTSGNLP